MKIGTKTINHWKKGDEIKQKPQEQLYNALITAAPAAAAACDDKIHIQIIIIIIIIMINSIFFIITGKNTQKLL